ncbi:hypothetical protein EJB05_51927 [Eragrostis curvula]|uniref:Uncharacterized protein n=1 Tax=Eragrostis curvula TaxID=38414 RepID=A0A5J9SUD3_9POAL|nr:hypothetical protein EJB05_51927 [Eragrostis curvula]
MAAQALPLLRWGRTASSLRALSCPAAAPRILFSSLPPPRRRPLRGGSKVMLKGMDYTRSSRIGCRSRGSGRGRP